MKKIKHYIVRPLILIVLASLIFSFIAGTTDFTKWHIWLRAFYVGTLFVAFVVTDKN